MQLTQAYAAYSKNENIRYVSSSGGVFSLLAGYVIAKNGVVYGAAYAEDFSIHHVGVTDTEKLQVLRGAKYGQSHLDGCFEKVENDLQTGRTVLFSGTPCQVAGLIHYLQNKGILTEKLIAVDFVCHGTPVAKAWESYVKYRAGLDHGGVLPSKINLRCKDSGWSRYAYSVEFDYSGSGGRRVLAQNNQDLYMRLFVGDYILLKGCSACRFKGYERVSDFTLGDFWGIWDIDTSMDDNKGTSLVLTHSEKAEKILQELKDLMIAKQVILEEASRHNPSILTSVTHKPEREQVLALATAGKFDEIEKMDLFQSIEMNHASIVNRGINKIKRILRRDR